MQLAIVPGIKFGEFDIVGYKHAGNGNSVLYGSKKSLADAVTFAHKIDSSANIAVSPRCMETLDQKNKEIAGLIEEINRLLNIPKDTVWIPHKCVATKNYTVDKNENFNYSQFVNQGK